jgi:class I fructose-bisphosphate aldolase
MAKVNQIVELLGNQAEGLLTYKAKAFASEALHLPGPDFVDRIVAASDRSPHVLRSFQALLNHGQRRLSARCPKESNC